MSYKDIYMRRVPRSETSISTTVVLWLHLLLQMAESMMATYPQSTRITEYRIQASVHQKKTDNALNRLLIGSILKSDDRGPE
jgi:hypothetical protein